MAGGWVIVLLATALSIIMNESFKFVEVLSEKYSLLFNPILSEYILMTLLKYCKGVYV